LDVVETPLLPAIENYYSIGERGHLKNPQTVPAALGIDDGRVDTEAVDAMPAQRVGSAECRP